MGVRGSLRRELRSWVTSATGFVISALVLTVNMGVTVFATVETWACISGGSSKACRSLLEPEYRAMEDVSPLRHQRRVNANLAILILGVALCLSTAVGLALMLHAWRTGCTPSTTIAMWLLFGANAVASISATLMWAIYFGLASASGMTWGSGGYAGTIAALILSVWPLVHAIALTHEALVWNVLEKYVAVAQDEDEMSML